MPMHLVHRFPVNKTEYEGLEKELAVFKRMGLSGQSTG